MSTAARMGQALTVAIVIVAIIWVIVAIVSDRRRVRALRAQWLAQLATQALDELDACDRKDTDAPLLVVWSSSEGEPRLVPLEPEYESEAAEGANALESYRSMPPL